MDEIKPNSVVFEPESSRRSILQSLDLDEELSYSKATSRNFNRSSLIPADEGNLNNVEACMLKIFFSLVFITSIILSILFGVGWSQKGTSNVQTMRTMEDNLSVGINTPFSKLYPLFTKKMSPLQQNEILLLLDSKTTNNFASDVLSKCFGKISISLEELKEMSNKSLNNVFIEVSSLNNLSSLKSTNIRFRVFSFIQNPIISSFMKRDKISTAQTKREKYSLKQRSNNLLTRSIVSKPKAELTAADLDVAEKFIEEFINIGVINDDLDIIKTFQETYNWKMDKLFVKQCTNKLLKVAVEKQASYFIPGDKLKKSVLSNFYDLSIYFNLTRHIYTT